MPFPLKEFQTFQKFGSANHHPENSWALVYLLLDFLSSGDGALNAVQESWMKGFPRSLSEEKKKEAADKMLALADGLLDCLREWKETAEEEGSEAVMEEVLELGEAVLLETQDMGEFSRIVREEAVEILSDLCGACGVPIPKNGYRKIDLSLFEDSEIAEEVEEWIVALTSFDNAKEASDLEAGILVLFVKIFLFYIFFN